MKLIFRFFLLLSTAACRAQVPSEMFVDKAFVILASTSSLSEARAIAQVAAQKTGLPFLDYHLKLNEAIGVTVSADICKESGFQYPCYISRGRSKDGAYLTVEYSSEYNGFTPKLFLVMAGSGYPNMPEVAAALKRVKPFYPASYAKRSPVYMGCMH